MHARINLLAQNTRPLLIRDSQVLNISCQDLVCIGEIDHEQNAMDPHEKKPSRFYIASFSYPIFH